MSPPTQITTADLASQSAQLLPRRETLSCHYGCVNVTNVVGVNIAIAINAASINASANAFASQYLLSLHH